MRVRSSAASARERSERAAVSPASRRVGNGTPCRCLRPAQGCAFLLQLFLSSSNSCAFGPANDFTGRGVAA